jgi:hypothetical protein
VAVYIVESERRRTATGLVACIVADVDFKAATWLSDSERFETSFISGWRRNYIKVRRDQGLNLGRWNSRARVEVNETSWHMLVSRCILYTSTAAPYNPASCSLPRKNPGASVAIEVHFPLSACQEAPPCRFEIAKHTS